ncbi:MAG: ammonium transporter, partial [Brachymonas sp.]|nr:ammonium transporter [Brachymonas sp.]
MMFAMITPTLMTGAFANRVSFKAWLWILVLWQLLVYSPFVHMIWSPEGIMAKWGVLDFAGGVVVHNTAGFASIASVLYVGKRAVKHSHPHSITLVALGTALLWFGWFCFNSGSEFRMDQMEVSAFANTHLAAGFGGVTWLVYEWGHTGKPKVLGFLTGTIAGLATVTPAVGYISPTFACVIGILASLVCYSAVLFKNKIGLDDALDVWPVHGVGGLMGMLWLGMFADKAWNPNSVWSNGLLLGGNPKFFGVQVLSVVISSIWSFFVTYALFWLVDRITPVRVPESYEEVGLDISLHGELAEVADH